MPLMTGINERFVNDPTIYFLQTSETALQKVCVIKIKTCGRKLVYVCAEAKFSFEKVYKGKLPCKGIFD